VFYSDDILLSVILFLLPVTCLVYSDAAIDNSKRTIITYSELLQAWQIHSVVREFTVNNKVMLDSRLCPWYTVHDECLGDVHK